ncbi:MAG TPA: hypothetical protein GX532_06825, partial [Clostridia bacterium]|nr:hypothetical protein [Clostridia bacterium]
MVFVFLVVVAGFSSLGLFLLMEKGRKEVKAGAKVSRFTAQSDSVLTLQSSNDLIDYDIYIMSKREWLFNFCLATGFLFLVAYIFYRSILLSVLVIPLAFFYPRLKTKEIIRKRKQELSLQFKEALYA